jgi:hypothetical protein
MRKRLLISLLTERRWMWPRLGVVTGVLLIILFWQFPGRLTPITSFNDCAQAGYLVTDTNPPACRAPGRTFVGPRQPESTPGPAQTLQTFQLDVQGDSHGDYPAKQQIIRDQVTWQRFWREVHAAETPVPPIIGVDFTTYDIIALTEGPKPTGGYNLKVVSVLVGPAGSTVNVKEQVPTVTCVVTHAVTNRYYIARTAKLPEPVSFRSSTEYRRCDR